MHYIIYVPVEKYITTESFSFPRFKRIENYLRTGRDKNDIFCIRFLALSIMNIQFDKFTYCCRLTMYWKTLKLYVDIKIRI